jgi:CBS domain-containing protein
VVLVTNNTQAAGTRDVVANPFTDDDGTAVPLAAYQIGRYIIVDADGSPALREITNVVGDNVTFANAANPLVEDDTFITDYYLPDTPDSQEGKAIVNYNGSIIVKLGDIDWSLATGINLSGGYAAASGNPVSGDSVEAAIQKLDGNNDAQDSLLGRTQGSTDLGASSVNGNVVSENATVKQAIDELDAAASGAPKDETGVSSNTTLDQVMTGKLSTIAPDRPLLHALHIMHDNGFRHMPVVQGGKPVGMLSIRDALDYELVHFVKEIEKKEALTEIIR